MKLALPEPSRHANLTRRLATATVIALAFYGAAATAIALVGFNDHASTADIIVVPGNTVRADGSVSERLQSRLDVALQLFHEGRAPIIFVSGGMGREGRDEATAMAAYLVAQGVAASAIAQDPLGADTAATAVNAAKYLRANRLQSAIVATQYFHVARTTLALERSGISVTGTRHARYFELRDAYSLAREVVGYAAYYAQP
jgi:vancomycin permeability regulator SanA